MFRKDYPQEPTDVAKVDSSMYDAELIGENDLGTVHVHGPYGNSKSNVEIAYLIGMHPMESKAHRGLFDTIVEWDKKGLLNYTYYIYNINVAGELDAETEGRMDGQLLAQEFAAPHIINSKYDFFADIHSNKGLKGPGTYEKTNFIFAPGFDDESSNRLKVILEKIEELVYYAPEYRASPPYITIPVVESGIPTIVYETYSYEPMERTYDLSEKLVKAIDNLEF
ncbi:adhesin [uncultured Methanobrevibacter sp.]|uniref:adhesin n=1 Tax=uncultured Methanobrevibacter sp. TaxID=253161 RepID=UPI0025F23610|nr:adhesin [uncultured Methanobrevibacter sp.]